MSTITINLTDEQERYLKEFALKQFSGSKDNVCTDRPLHTVQTQEERVVDSDHEDTDKVSYFVSEWGEGYETMQELIKAYYKHEHVECPIEIVDFQVAYDASEFFDVNGEEQVICDEDDYLEAYGVPKEFYYKVNTVFDYRTVAVFFILDEAKKYLEYQGHNLTNPRTYTIGAGYANKGEYHHFWDLLFNIGEQLNSLTAHELPEEIEKMKYPECSACKCNTCEDDYCKTESCNEGCRENTINPVLGDCHGHERSEMEGKDAKVQR